MSNPITWVATHEPVLAGGVTAAVGVAVLLSEATPTNGGLIGAISASLALLAGFVSRFTTSPATRTKIQDGIDALPQVAADATQAIRTAQAVKAAFEAQKEGIVAEAKLYINHHVSGHLDAFDHVVDDAFKALNAGARDGVAQIKASVEARPPVTAPIDSQPVSLPAPVATVIPDDPFEHLEQVAAKDVLDETVPEPEPTS